MRILTLHLNLKGQIRCAAISILGSGISGSGSIARISSRREITVDLRSFDKEHPIAHQQRSHWWHIYVIVGSLALYTNRSAGDLWLSQILATTRNSTLDKLMRVQAWDGNISRTE